MSFKPLFSKSLAADPDRLHFAAHSHHLWPDSSFEGHNEAWADAARLADRKWDKVMGEIWPEAQRHVAREIGTGTPDAIAFSPNTHDFIVRLMSAVPRNGKAVKILTSDGEFHSARRQFDRWAEDGSIVIETVCAEPYDTFADRFIERARSSAPDLVFVSQVLFSSGQIFGAVDELAALARPEGPWVVIDGYHSFMAVPQPFSANAGASAFFLGGGYKYAMAGEGCAFLHAPEGFGPRPSVTGWFAEFEDLTLPPGAIGYAPDGRRFLGATFDPSGLYRFNSVQRMLFENALDTARVSALVSALQRQLLECIDDTALGQAMLLNPLSTVERHARFLAFRDPRAKQWYEQLNASNVITDVRGDVLRIGFALYHDAGDVERLSDALGRLT